MVFSVAGSITSKRAPSEALRHLPPIHRSVGTLARRFSYMSRFLSIEVSGAAVSVGSLSHGERGGVRGYGLSRGSNFLTPLSPLRGEGAHRVRRTAGVTHHQLFIERFTRS